MAFADESLIVDVAVADEYHSARGNVAWAALSSIAKHAALVNATDYVEITYADRFVGEKASLTQQLSWPRRNVPGTPSDVTPVGVVRAVCELALRAGSGTKLIADESKAVVREKVDVIEVEYAENQSQQPGFVVVERLLAGYLRGASVGATCVRLVRV